MVLIELLVLYEHASVFLKCLWEAGKEWMRKQLGASTNTSYLLLENDTIIPDTLVHCKYLPAATYDPITKRISSTTDANYKRLPWLSVQHIMGDHVVDISEWMADVRSNASVSLLALLRLASYIHAIHLPETDHAIIRVITRGGEEEEYKYKGTTALVQRITPTPKQYDIMEGMPLI